MQYSELVCLTEEDPEQARAAIEAALVTSSGDMDRAASALGVAKRTLQRCVTSLAMDLHALREAQGWKTRTRGNRELRGLLLEYLQVTKDRQQDLGRAAVILYGEDIRATRQRVYMMLNNMRLGGLVRRLNDGTWEVI